MPVEFEDDLYGIERRLSAVEDIVSSEERLAAVQQAIRDLLAVQHAAEEMVVPHRDWLVARVDGLASKCLEAYSAAMKERLRPALLEWRQRAKETSQRGVEPAKRKQKIAEVNAFLSAIREPLRQVEPVERKELDALRAEIKSYEQDARRFLRGAEPPRLGYLRRIDRSRRR